MLVKFRYKNHRGEVEDREVNVTSLDYYPMPNFDYGHGPGWFLSGYDHSRGRGGTVFRSFALANIQLPLDAFINPTNDRPIRFTLG